MPLELPENWVSLPAPVQPSLFAKWGLVKDVRPPAEFATSVPAEAFALVHEHLVYERDPGGDDWQNPLESLKRGIGDCEDFAIFYRAVLLNGGFEGDIHLLIVKDIVCKLDHALLWLPDCYLDCRASRPLPHDTFRDYRPILAFSDEPPLTFGRRR